MSGTDQSKQGNGDPKDVKGQKNTFKMKSGDKPEIPAVRATLDEIPSLEQLAERPTTMRGLGEKTLDSAGNEPLASVTAEFDPLAGPVKAHPFRGGVQMAYERYEGSHRPETGGRYSDEPPGLSSDRPCPGVAATAGPLTDAVGHELPTEPIDREAVEAAAATKPYSVLDDPELDQDMLEQMSAEDLAELERKLAQVDAMFAEQEAAPPPDVEDVGDDEGGVMASGGKAAARAAASGALPKRIKAKTQIVKKVVERSRILDTQPAMQRPVPPAVPDPAVEQDAGPQPKPRVGIWLVGALLVVAVGVIIWVAQQRPERDSALGDRPSATTTTDPEPTPTQTIGAAGSATRAVPQPPVPTASVSGATGVPTASTTSAPVATSSPLPQPPSAPTRSPATSPSTAPTASNQPLPQFPSLEDE